VNYIANLHIYYYECFTACDYKSNEYEQLHNIYILCAQIIVQTL